MPRAISELEKLSAEELRKLASSIRRDNPARKAELKYYYADTQEAIPGNTTPKKNDYIYSISLWESLLINPQVETVEATFEPEKAGDEITKDEAPQTIADTDELVEYSNYDEELRSVATKYYIGFDSKDSRVVGIREIAQNQLTKAQSNQPLALDASLFATVARFKEEILSIASKDSDTPNPNTAINLRTELFNRIKKAVTKEKERFKLTQEIDGLDPIDTNYLELAFEAFRSGVIASFSQIARQKREKTGDRLIERKTSTPHVNVAKAIHWAITRIKKAPIKSHEWREITLAILILTGRRPAEVLSSGVFEVIDDCHLSFKGQLKKKDEFDEFTYKIPTIGNTAREIKTAIDWLNMVNKRVVPASRSKEDKREAAEKAHDRFSRYMSIISKEVFKNQNTVELLNGSSWDAPENIDRVKAYLARQIYLQVISQLVNESINHGFSINADLALSYYAGHYLNVDGKDHNAENYTADILIKDIDEIKKIWNWQPSLTAAEINSIRQK
ncbi:hypothetical protein H6G27_34300 [Nostoc linckia FACHB-104]|nr:hypothetical protein [Nostoc linckia FACHB-104]